MWSHRRPGFLDPDQPPSRSGTRLGAVLGACAAAVASAGLAYWIGSAGDPTFKRPGHERPTYAPSEADAGQVVRAYQQVQDVYAKQGRTGVAGFARGCSGSLSADPAALDFCVAFDIYATSLMGEGERAQALRASATERELGLVRTALAPSEDPVARLARIRDLARSASLHDLDAPPAKVRPAPHRARRYSHRPAAQVGLQPVAETAPPALAAPVEPPEPQPVVQVPPGPSAEAKPRAKPAAVKKAAVKRPRREACRQKATAGERTVCASPALREADVQLQAAYRQALAAGVSPRQLARDQARFRRAVNAAAPDRVALERLYYQRTRALENLSQSP